MKYVWKKIIVACQKGIEWYSSLDAKYNYDIGQTVSGPGF
jgi:hypothetical protein